MLDSKKTPEIDAAVAAYAEAVALEIERSEENAVALKVYNFAAARFHAAQQARIRRGEDILKTISKGKV